jgi:chromosome segregation ATPase
VPYVLFSGPDGRISERLLLVPLSRGEYLLSLTDYFIVEEFASLRVSYVDEPLESIKEGVSSITSAISGLSTSIESRLDTIQSAIDSLSARIEVLGSSIEGITLLISAGFANVTGVLEEIREDSLVIRTELGELRVSLRAEADSIKSLVEDLRGLIDGQVVRRLVVLEGEAGSIKALIDTRVARIEGTLKELRGDVAVVSTSIGDIAVNLDNMRVELGSLGERLERSLEEAKTAASSAEEAARQSTRYSQTTTILSAIILAAVVATLLLPAVLRRGEGGQ